MIIAVDFDGTLFENKWPDIGEPKLHVIEYVKKRKVKGDTIILWTCRHGELLKNAIEACQKYGLTFDYVNEQAKETLEMFGPVDCRKLSADIYIDDKAVNVSHLDLFKEVL